MTWTDWLLLIPPANVREPSVRNALVLGEGCCHVNDPGWSREWWEKAMDEWLFIERLLLTDAEFRARYEIAKAEEERRART